jgi:hypothetical protein
MRRGVIDVSRLDEPEVEEQQRQSELRKAKAALNKQQAAVQRTTVRIRELEELLDESPT